MIDQKLRASALPAGQLWHSCRCRSHHVRAIQTGADTQYWLHRLPAACWLPCMACHTALTSHDRAAALFVADLARLVAVAGRDQSLHQIRRW